MSYNVNNRSHQVNLKGERPPARRDMGETELVRRGPNRRGIERRRQIVDAAAAVFAELGYSGGSVRMIADRIGSSPASLIQLFGSKEGLLIAVLEDWSQRSRPAEPSQETGISWFTRLPEVMRYNIANRGLIELFLTMAAEASNSQHPAHQFIADRYATIVEEVSRHFQEAIDAGDFHPMSDQEIDQETRILFAVMDGLELQWLINPDSDLASTFRSYIDLALGRWSVRTLETR
jgi:AcrR family transcriptional regulator